MTEVGILGSSGTGSSRSLTESITFKDRTGEADLKESKHILFDGGRSSDHELYLSSHHGLDLLEHEEVIAAVSVSRVCVQVGSFGGDATVNEEGLAARELIELSLDLGVDLVVETRHGREDSGLEFRHVVQ